MTGRERFRAACIGEKLDRPPVWLMRQAGRYLPEYRALKEQHSFLEMVQTPELAAQVTRQPIERFGFDAAIIFSDILVIPEAMGQPYSFREQGGIEMAFAVQTEADITRLSVDGVAEKLAYVPAALSLTREKLGDKTALIGFAGSPWTLATYMIEGGSSKEYAGIKTLLYSNPALLETLLDKITLAVIQYLKTQVAAGVDAVQIFDSWGGILSHDTFWRGSGQYMARIVEALQADVPVIVYSKGSHHWLADLKRTGAAILGVDWTIPVENFYDALGGGIAVQGNLDPVLMSTEPDVVRRETMKILLAMQNRPGHIFNLGHGILPSAKLSCVETLVDTIRNFQGEV
ncbi:MAG: uroporphyrinogen decarboxylase [Lentisphaeria bacterium]|nr:uroporphyrinogen decarboxylase [Candidatus Neomarinimicrobiota bacterium]MCF7842761.1 uroporphyrinogen decarboxylase [Lentisphaeria bacterium]